MKRPEIKDPELFNFVLTHVLDHLDRCRREYFANEVPRLLEEYRQQKGGRDEDRAAPPPV